VASFALVASTWLADVEARIVAVKIPAMMFCSGILPDLAKRAAGKNSLTP
jgi:hypothetical protein